MHIVHSCQVKSQKISLFLTELTVQKQDKTVRLFRMDNTIAIRKHLGEQALELIKTDIFSLHYPPGTRLIVDNLAEQFNISRTPVRDALRELVSQGLVEYDGLKYKVIDIDKKSIDDLYSIRIPLESLAAECAARSDVSQQLIAIKENSIKYFQADDILDIIELDMNFHLYVAEASHNKRLFQFISMLMDQSKLINHWLFRENPDKGLERPTINEHLVILEKIERRDSSDASKQMMKHLEQGRQRALQYLH